MPLERSLLFYPRPYPDGNWQPKTITPEDAWFDAPDGVRLHGWFAEAQDPRAVVLFCHGNGGNVASWGWVLRLYRDRLNASVLVFDYRGYGKSEGTPSEAGILADARAARRWLANRTGVSEADIVMAGKSLGGGVAVDLAAKDGARALILESTFTSLPEVATNHLPWLPAQWLMNTRLNSLAQIGNYHGPLLQSHGDTDQTVPYELGRKLFEAANEPKRFVILPGGGHNDLPAREYMQILDEFIASLPSTAAESSPPPPRSVSPPCRGR
jgi:fermentation-respiration switch protein FrsA (DUF1100 family)